MSYLRCLTPTKAEYAMRKMHERIYGNHLRAQAGQKQILLVDYEGERRSNGQEV